MEQKQGKTLIKTDNSTANKFSNNNIKHRHSKHMDMCYHWIKDRQNQQQFQVYWRPGTENNADYYSKHFNDIEHRKRRPKYVNHLQESDEGVLIQPSRTTDRQGYSVLQPKRLYH